MKKHLLLICLCALQLPLFSIEPIIRNFTREDSKSGTQNWSITQHSSNMIYFANNAGLLEYDGKNWNTYPIENGTNIRSVLYADNKIYAGASNEFGYYEYDSLGGLKYHSLRSKLDKSIEDVSEVWNIYKGKEQIYFQTDKYILEYINNEVVARAFQNKIDVSAFVHNIFFVSCYEEGAFMLNGDIFIQIPGGQLLSNKKVCAILPFESKKVLFVTRFHGAFVFDGNSITPYKTNIDDFLIKNQVFCAARNGNVIVFGTVQQGAAIYNVKDGSCMYVNTSSGLQNNTVLSAFFDNNHNLWLGLDKGIGYAMINSSVYNMFGTNNSYGAGYASLLHENILYLGTNQGLYKTNYPVNNTPEGIKIDAFKDLRGQVWHLNNVDNTVFCGNDQGLFIVYPHRVEKLPQIQGSWGLKKLKHYPDMILGCSYQGLYILKKKNNTWNFSHYIKGDFKEVSSMFEEADDGTIWFSHWQKGVFRLQLDKHADSIVNVKLYDQEKGFPTNRNNTFYKIKDKLIFSSEYGFFNYDPASDSMVKNEEWNSLFVQPPNSIRLWESLTGDVWCISGTFLGLAKLQKDQSYVIDSMTYRILQPKIIIGFENLNFIDDENIIISTEDNFSWIKMNQAIRTKEVFNVFLRNVMITNKGKAVNMSLPECETGRNDIFPKNQNSVRFEYIAPFFQNNNSVTYSYMLENFDQEWSDFSSANIKEYTSLPKGDYVFKIKAKENLEGNEAECSYHFSILPAWYETKFLQVIYVLLIIGGVIGLIMFIKHRSEKGALEMEKKKELELREKEEIFEKESIEKQKEIIELKNQKLKYELRHKSQELANSAMNLVRKNEMLIQITEGLEKLNINIQEDKEKQVIVQEINRILHDIKENISNDDTWTRFEENFDMVYEDYLKRLSSTFPELNLNDKKLCAFLKMGLTSKDIASILGTSIRSVETNRYRLRKKMDLNRDANLSDFLQRF